MKRKELTKTFMMVEIGKKVGLHGLYKIIQSFKVNFIIHHKSDASGIIPFICCRKYRLVTFPERTCVFCRQEMIWTGMKTSSNTR